MSKFFQLLTRYEVILLTFNKKNYLLIATRGGPVVTDWVVWIHSVWERNILADVQYSVADGCRRGKEAPAPYYGEIGADNYINFISGLWFDKQVEDSRKRREWIPNGPWSSKPD